MPIKFRCDYCRQLMGIAHTKAGSLVDCPTCGRTLRVPNEDGTVDPAPEVGINRKDDELRRALDEVGQIGQPEKPPGPVSSELASAEAAPRPLVGKETTQGSGETPPVIMKPVAIVPSPPPPPVQTNAIALEPLPPIGAVNPPIPSRANSAGTKRAVPWVMQSPEQILADLAGSVSVIRPAVVVEAGIPEPRTYALKWMILASVVSALVGGGIGFLVGLSSGERTGTERPLVVVPDAATETVPAKTLVQGHLTFRNARGQLEPDAGACLILLPTPRAAAAKLPSTGLRPNDEADVREQVLKTLQEQGGQLAIADADGGYQVELSKAGDYQLIALSHFQGRPADNSNSSEALKSLAQIFERPEQLVGKLAFTVAEIKHAGTGPVIWDHTFAN